MENFLKDNQDFAYHTNNTDNKDHAEDNNAGTPSLAVAENEWQERKNKKSKRFATAVIACVLVAVFGLGSGVGGTLLAAHILVAEASNSRNLGDVPQLPGNVNVAEDYPTNRSGELSLISDDTLVVNNNNTELTPAQLYKKVHEGVVGIEISMSLGGRFTATFEETQLVGTGFIFTTDGYVLTNHHVIEDATSVVVLVNDYDDPSEVHRYKAEIVGSDSSTDLAVLKISRDEEFRAVPIGDSSTLEVGAFVCAIGYPLGIEKSMTFGIVSGLDREFESGGFELSSIQFDAAVNFGNSGGPLFDMYGNVVGVVNKKLIYENYVDNIGLAITIDEAKPIINDLLLHGEVMSRPMLGITNIVLNEYTAAFYGVGVTEGIWVTWINPKAPAINSDLMVGDIIVEVNGAAIASVADVQTQIRNNKPGDIVELTVIRFNDAGNQRRIIVEIELANSAELD
ncbi:MAG: S1C family serine protease [Oscillospiraceae bacterium]|nr:S1C family serine protease [Oscillospiraceae bacterium]